ncbi:cysteine peptidase family C39 domain-containing protein [Candidatus Uabimicrobium amorphum]|uniref:Peptidase C39 domain-containing protein n=1 Tax=Uabimicrobium amorphum TaxID=2596890 RepID=A0A5S9IQW3_UABAM|nr:cysteine peptidase family C39 domain-containing protein [Candidatus Uabimicrobium amorphum]BBM86419.1 hypothetical protein UABAM_04805 [Candidatus Uabimicrobium amorphum]
MKIAIFALSLIVSIGLYRLGCFFAKSNKKTVVCLAILSLTICFVLEILRVYRAWLAALVPIDIAVYMEKGAFVPFAVFFFAICSKSVSSKFTEKALHGICFLAIGYMCVYSSWMIMPVVKCGNFKIVDSVCIQSTPTTCGPACLTTIARFHGLKTTEQQMAHLSHTTNVWGTTSLRMLKAMRDFLTPQKRLFSASVHYTDWEGLQKISKPCIVNTEYSTYVNHVMVLFAIENGRVVLGDPLEGRIYLSKNRFMRMWTTEVITFNIK